MRGLHLPHHDGGPLSVATQDPSLGDRVEVRVRVPMQAQPDRIHLRTTLAAEPSFAPLVPAGTDELGAAVWAGEVTVGEPCTGYRFLLEGGPVRYGWLTQAGVVLHDVTDETDFRLLAHPGPPDWVADQWLYQVFPDRFARSGRVGTDRFPDWAVPADWGDTPATDVPLSVQQLYGGDLWGVLEHLDHLEQLGVSGAYLNPVFPARDNHRYNAVAFDHVDPVLGGDEALAALTAAMHARGMRLVGDLTANHSGSEHPWFVAAQAGHEPERGFYHFTEWPHAYDSWNDVGSLPKFDHRDAELRRRLYEGDDSVVARWIADPIALDGWRVDAANMTGRTRDVDVNGRVAASILATMRAARGDDVYLLAEHCHDASRDLERPGWHGTMNYTGFTRPVWSWLRAPGEDRGWSYLGSPLPLPRHTAGTTVETMVRGMSRMPWRALAASLTLLGSHDTARWRSVAGDRERALVGFGLLATLPGVPSMLYGDEWGLEGDTDSASRRPMPWDRPQDRDEELLAGVRRMIALRRSSPALRRGGLRWAMPADVDTQAATDVVVFVREHPDERLLVAASRAAHPDVAVRVGTDAPRGGDPLLDHPPLPPATEGGLLVLPAADSPGVAVWRIA